MRHQALLKQHGAGNAVKLTMSKSVPREQVWKRSKHNSSNEATWRRQSFQADSLKVGAAITSARFQADSVKVGAAITSMRFQADSVTLGGDTTMRHQALLKQHGAGNAVKLTMSKSVPQEQVWKR
jgi:hypothetical protein